LLVKKLSDSIRMTTINGNDKKLKILMIGPLPPPIGGIAVSFEILVNLLYHRDDVDIEVVDFSDIRNRKGNSLRGLLCLCRAVLSKAKQADVISVYFASTALPTLGLLLLVISHVLGKPFIVRKGGGDDYFDLLGFVKGHIAHFVVKHADLYLAQTQNLVRIAQHKGIPSVKWYPTSRLKGDHENLTPLGNTPCRRFVYVGHVRENKGMHALAEAAKQLPESVTIDVYGPWFDCLDRHVFDNSPNIRYQGVLKPEEVVATMRKYDAAVLPTKARTEGYTGMVLESYTAGLPIVASKIGGIPEIVDDTIGILVEPDSVEDLCKAMTQLTQDNELFNRLRANTREKAKFFSSERWANEFVKYCLILNRWKNEKIGKGHF
jgi:glycosyltransferase involved in cell wall biosynthesis